MDLAKLKSRYERKVGQKQQLEKQLLQITEDLKQEKRQHLIIEKAKNIVRAVALETQSQLEYRIASTVSAAQQAVFDEPYELLVKFEERRGKTECDLFFSRDGQKFDPLSSSGYGVVDIASFALRVAAWSMSRNTRPVLILDEPFKHLKGAETNYRAINMVKEISDQLGLQILMVSDERANREDIKEGADKLFVVSTKDNVAVLKEES